jgi:hypothetical protein
MGGSLSVKSPYALFARLGAFGVSDFNGKTLICSNEEFVIVSQAYSKLVKVFPGMCIFVMDLEYVGSCYIRIQHDDVVARVSGGNLHLVIRLD